RMHGDDEFIALAEPGRHGRGQPSLVLHPARRMARGKAREQAWEEDRSGILHHAEADDGLRLACTESADCFRMKGKDALRISAQLIARGGRHDAGAIALKQLHAEPLLEPPDL